MWRPQEEIEADLSSRQADRLAAGIRDLEDRIWLVDEFPLPPLDLASVLEVFGEELPAETSRSLLNIVTLYDAFTRPLSPEQRRAASVELLRRGGSGGVALPLAMWLKGLADPEREISETIGEIARQGIGNAKELAAIQDFLSYLIAGTDSVRQATISSVKDWHRDPDLRVAVEFLAPELAPDEQELVHLA